MVGLALLVASAAKPAQAHYEICHVVGGDDPCLSQEKCSATDGTAGICLPPPCADARDCRALLSLCDRRKEPFVCIECTIDADCRAPSTCQLDPSSPVSSRCVACLPGHDATCAEVPSGHRCAFGTGERGGAPRRSSLQRSLLTPVATWFWLPAGPPARWRRRLDGPIRPRRWGSSP